MGNLQCDVFSVFVSLSISLSFVFSWQPPLGAMYFISSFHLFFKGFSKSRFPPQKETLFGSFENQTEFLWKLEDISKAIVTLFFL